MLYQGLQHISISFWYSGALDTSQALEVVENAEKSTFQGFPQNLMSMFSSQKGHTEKRVPNPKTTTNVPTDFKKILEIERL